MTPEERFEKIENAIRDLIVVSRTVLEAQQHTERQWRESHRDHEEKLKA
jgi:hypothetical protein